MNEQIKIASDVVSILETIDGSDLDFVLCVIEARFPRGGNRAKNPLKAKRGARPVTVKSPPTVAPAKAGSVGRVGGGCDAPVTVVRDSSDVLKDALLKLGPIVAVVPDVSRDPSADTPDMSRKSVQKRLNKKRAELYKELCTFLDERTDLLAFEALNGIQRFRLAASDAFATEGVRLRTDPIPEDFVLGVDQLRSVAQERISSGMVSVFGFFTNEDHHYSTSSEVGGEMTSSGS
jgi:hypothetical protein